MARLGKGQLVHVTQYSEYNRAVTRLGKGEMSPLPGTV